MLVDPTTMVHPQTRVVQTTSSSTTELHCKFASARADNTATSPRGVAELAALPETRAAWWAPPPSATPTGITRWMPPATLTSSACPGNARRSSVSATNTTATDKPSTAAEVTAPVCTPGEPTCNGMLVSVCEADGSGPQDGGA